MRLSLLPIPFASPNFVAKALISTTPRRSQAMAPIMASTRRSSLFLLSLAALLVSAASQPPCSAGSFINSSGCVRCPKQRISTTPDSTECTLCADGTIPNSGRTACIPCPAGRFFMVGSLSPCRRCPIDTFSPVAGAFSCTPCPPGTISPFASTRESQCITCPPGTVVFRSRGKQKQLRCVPCGPGLSTFTENAIECKPCPKGSFRKVSGSRGYFGSKTFRMLVDENVTVRQLPRAFGGMCRLCPTGTFSDMTGAKECSKCPEGMYQDELGADSCKTCPTDSTTTRRGASECRSTCNSSLPGCVSCTRGEGLNAATERCEACPSGTVSLTTGSATPCYPCPPGGSVPNALRTKCECPDGSNPSRDKTCPV